MSDRATFEDAMEMAKTDGMEILYSGTFSILYHDPPNLTDSCPMHLGLMLCLPWGKDPSPAEH